MEFSGQFVMVMSCSRCNVSCKHCYISYNGNFSPEELKKVTKELGKKYNIMINGAEPLVNLKYLESYPEINQEHILTNGLSLIKEYDKVVAELKKQRINKVSISYHFDMHNEFSKIKENDLELVFKKLKQDGFYTRIMTTITSKNYNYIEQYCKIANEIGVNAIKFTNFIYQGKATYLDKELILNEEQRREFFYQLNNARKKYTKDQLYIERCGTFGKNPTKIDNKFRCGAGTELVVITPDKKVYPCVFLAKEGNEIGIYKNGAIEIYNKFQNDGTKCIACDKCNKKNK